MKKTKRALVVIVFLLFSFMVIYSCRKDLSKAEVQDAPETEINFSVKNARSYFYNTLRKAQEAKAKVSTLQKKDKIYPYWYYAYEATTPKYSFVEVPITGDETRSYTARASSEQLASATENLQVLNGSLRRLVMYKDKNGVIGERIITYIPDLAYLKKHNNDISHNQINKLDKDYSGYLRYSSIDGSYLFMLRIKNGRTIGKHSANKSKAGKNKKVAGTSTLEEICDVIHWVEWEQECTSYYPDGPEEPGEEICGEWYIVDEWDEVIDCYVDCSDPANFYDAECYDDGGNNGGNNGEYLTSCLNTQTDRWVTELEDLNTVRDTREMQCYSNSIGLPLLDLLAIFPSLYDAIINARSTSGGSLADIDWSGIESFVVDILQTKQDILTCIAAEENTFENNFYIKYNNFQNQIQFCYDQYSY